MDLVGFHVVRAYHHGFDVVGAAIHSPRGPKHFGSVLEAIATRQERSRVIILLRNHLNSADPS